MPSLRAAKRRQTKLSFSPQSTTSKYANVTYEGSPAKKRKTNRGQQQLDSMFRSDGPSSSIIAAGAGPASPLRSSQAIPMGKTYSSDEEPGDDGHAVSDETDSDIPAPKTKAKRRSRHHEPTSTNIFQRAPIISPKPKDKPKPVKEKGRKNGKANVTDVATAGDELESDGDENGNSDLALALPTRPSPKSNQSTRSSRKVKNKVSLVHIISSEEETDTTPQEDSDEDIEPVTPTRSRLPKPPPLEQHSDEEEDIMPATQRRRAVAHDPSDSENDVQPSTQRRRTVEKPARHAATTDPDQDEVDDDDDDEDAYVKTPSHKGRRPTRRLSRDSEEEDVAPKTPSRRHQRRRRTSSEEAEAAELAADAKELKRSTVFKKEKVGRLRDRAGNNKVNDRRSRLEQLKAQREGRTIDITDDEEEDDEGEEGDDAIELTGSEDEDEDEEEAWIIDNDEESRTLADNGTSAEMQPLEMMRHGQLNLKNHFLYVVHWMVTSRFNPAEAEELRELYELSTHRVNREAQGLTDRLVSSAWVAPFVHILKARPEYSEMEIGGSLGIGNDRCAACNRGGHPAKFLVKLAGRAYSRKKLEPLKDASLSDSEGDSDDDAPSEDEEGHQLVSDDREWYLGSFCRSNAMNAHSLIHWQIHLRDWLSVYMDAQGFNRPDEVVKRDGWSQQRKRRFVDDVMAELEGSGQIRALWKDLQAKMKAAPEVMGQRGWK